MANYTSAKLLLGTKMTVKQVSSKSLRGVGHGLAIGIAGAPDALPSAGSGAATAWTACAARGAGGGGLAGGATATTTLELTRRPAGMAPTTGQAFAVVNPEGARYLVWAGRRHRLTEEWLSRVLGFDDAQLVPVTTQWLKLVAEGPDITPIRVKGAGTARTVGGRQAKIGQLFVFAGDSGVRNHYLLLDDSTFAPMTSMAVQMVRGDPMRASAGLNTDPIELNPSQRAGIRESPTALLAKELPESVPAPVRVPAGQALCARYRPGASGVEVVLGTVPQSGRAIEPQGGALVVPCWPGQTSAATLFLVTDTGVRYPVASLTIAERLGYPKGFGGSGSAAAAGVAPTGSSPRPGRDYTLTVILLLPNVALDLLYSNRGPAIRPDAPTTEEVNPWPMRSLVMMAVVPR